MQQLFPDIMVDVETTGTQPNRSAMIQLAAVRFNLKERTVASDSFVRSMAIPAWRYWDEDTRAWWSKMPEVYRAIVERSELPNLVMKEFADYTIDPAGPMRFWAKPTTFDYPFVTSYLKDFGQPIPFDFREATDMRSYLRGLYNAMDLDLDESLNPPFVGTQHNAYHDVLHQIKVLFFHTDRIQNTVRELKETAYQYESVSA